MDLEIKGWIERDPAKVITTFSRLYCSIISRGDFSSKIESLRQNISEKGIIWPSKIQLETSESEKNDWKMVFKTVQSRLPRKKHPSLVGEWIIRNNLWSCFRIPLIYGFKRWIGPSSQLPGITWHQPSTTTAPWCRVPHQTRWCRRGYLRNFSRRKCEWIMDGYHPKNSCKGYSPLIIHYNQ